MDQNALARRLRKQDERLYEQLMANYGRLLWTIVSGILAGCGTKEDVEEVVSDVFVELWQNPHLFDPSRGEIKAFLCVKAKSRAIDRLRQLRRVDAVPLDEVEDSAAGDLLEQLLSPMTLGRILGLLAEMGQPDQEILTLRLIYTVKPADIAAKLRLPVNLVYEKIRRGKAKLASALKREGMYDG